MKITTAESSLQLPHEILTSEVPPQSPAKVPKVRPKPSNPTTPALSGVISIGLLASRAMDDHHRVKPTLAIYTKILGAQIFVTSMGQDFAQHHFKIFTRRRDNNIESQYGISSVFILIFTCLMVVVTGLAELHRRVNPTPSKKQEPQYNPIQETCSQKLEPKYKYNAASLRLDY